MAAPLQVRIDPDIAKAVSRMSTSPVNPHFYNRSAASIINELLRGSQAFREAVAQQASEAHPRPFKK